MKYYPDSQYQLTHVKFPNDPPGFQSSKAITIYSRAADEKMIFIFISELVTDFTIGGKFIENTANSAVLTRNIYQNAVIMDQSSNIYIASQNVVDSKLLIAKITPQISSTFTSVWGLIDLFSEESVSSALAFDSSQSFIYSLNQYRNISTGDITYAIQKISTNGNVIKSYATNYNNIEDSAAQSMFTAISTVQIQTTDYLFSCGVLQFEVSIVYKSLLLALEIDALTDLITNQKYIEFSQNNFSKKCLDVTSDLTNYVYYALFLHEQSKDMHLYSVVEQFFTERPIITVKSLGYPGGIMELYDVYLIPQTPLQIFFVGKFINLHLSYSTSQGLFSTWDQNRVCSENQVTPQEDQGSPYLDVYNNVFVEQTLDLHSFPVTFNQQTPLLDFKDFAPADGFNEKMNSYCDGLYTPAFVNESSNITIIHLLDSGDMMYDLYELFIGDEQCAADIFRTYTVTPLASNSVLISFDNIYTISASSGNQEESYNPVEIVCEFTDGQKLVVNGSVAFINCTVNQVTYQHLRLKRIVMWQSSGIY
eukprot:403343666